MALTMEENTPASLKWLTVVAILALIWNLIGVASVFLTMNLTPDSLIAQGWTDTQTAYFMSTPVWAKFANGFAILTGMLGAGSLLMRRKAAYGFFAISLLAIMVVMVDAFLRGGFGIVGMASNGLSIAVIVIAIFLFWTTHVAQTSGQLR